MEQASNPPVEGNMERLTTLENSVAAARRELSKLRQQMNAMRHMFKNEISKIKQTLRSTNMEISDGVNCSGTARHDSDKCCGVVTDKPAETRIGQLNKLAIGHIETCFKEKNGTPRQPSICSEARGVITIEVYNNPDHSLNGLSEYSHIWIIFVFHKNDNDSSKAKVRPPRLDGKRLGVFACRTPHRPNPIGLTLARLTSIHKNTLCVSGIDLVDSTPILDIKPYIPEYDKPVINVASFVTTEASDKPRSTATEGIQLHSTVSPQCDANGRLIERDSSISGVDLLTSTEPIRTAGWLDNPPINTLQVEFSKEAEQQLAMFKCSNDATSLSSTWQVTTLPSSDVVRQSIRQILREDPRSVYRRNKCSSDVYKMSIDNLNITCHFKGDTATVISIVPKHFK